MLRTAASRRCLVDGVKHLPRLLFLRFLTLAFSHAAARVSAPPLEEQEAFEEVEEAPPEALPVSLGKAKFP